MSTTTTSGATGSVADFLDTRLGASKAVRGLARKIFPDHWSFLLGEIALYSFIVLLLSGTFLTLWFNPSMGLVTYEGSYAPMNGLEMSEAFASTLHLSFDVRGGLLMRQIHHWAALLFVASMVVHMFRVFFTGAFRKPREVNWMIGSVLTLLGIAAGFTGYSLPDDMLSGNGLRIIDGIIKAIPVVGTYLSFFIFGGEFPGEAIIPRLFIAHVLLIPGILLALIGAHLGLVFLQKHTQYPGPGRTNDNVVGYPLMPVYMAKAGGFFFVVFGLIALVAATVQINAVWNYGPYDPSPISAGTQPDWYVGFLDGALRLMPGWEWTVLGFTLSFNILIPAVILPGLMVTALVAYPFIEAAATGDKREHHLLDRPRNNPTRTGLGVMAITFYGILWANGGNDIIATSLNMSINDLMWIFRIGLIVLPPIAFWVTKRIALGLQRKDRELALHGRETGRVVRTADGEYFEVHEPLSEQERWVLVQHPVYRPLEIEPEVDENGVRRPGARRDRWRQRLSRFYFEDRVEPPTPAEIEAAQRHGTHGEVETSDIQEAVASQPHR
ncbi:cytochrome bc complex cytochrome b subunit [Quadrisphaera sp. GCM10027208]|uniref:cytochrome bc1 complex cytochrome b subunit n=1 Tax=Quadrisphaera sp. GCM10027208 TaxID=3273423 RepID=UPI003618DCFC